MDAATKQHVAGEIEFRPFTEDDLADISQLITGMSDDDEGLQLRDKTAAYYRWMYYDNPAGPAWLLGPPRRPDRDLVRARAQGLHGRRRVVVGKTMDMFTDPEYQGMGSSPCADAVFDAAPDAGIHGWYVTPSVNSYPIFAGKWGYREDFDAGLPALRRSSDRAGCGAAQASGVWVGGVADRLSVRCSVGRPKLPGRVHRSPNSPGSTTGPTHCGRRSRRQPGRAGPRRRVPELALRRQPRRLRPAGAAPGRPPRGDRGDQDDAQAGSAGRRDRRPRLRGATIRRHSGC